MRGGPQNDHYFPWGLRGVRCTYVSCAWVWSAVSSWGRSSAPTRTLWSLFFFFCNGQTPPGIQSRFVDRDVHLGSSEDPGGVYQRDLMVIVTDASTA